MHNLIEQKPQLSQNDHGQLGTMMIIAFVLIGFLLAALAVDVSHIAAVQAELSNATDAAALAGAQDLWFDLEQAVPHALKIAASNTVDGKALSTSTEGTNIDVTVTPPDGEIPGSVRCTARVKVFHMFAPMFGRSVDSITATSLAGTKGKMWLLGEGQAFPIAVSLDTVPKLEEGVGVALNSCSPGDHFTLYLGSQKVKNAAFTSFTSGSANANYIGQAIDQCLGLTSKVPGFIPAIQVGSNINLNNGIEGQKKLADTPYLEALRGKTIVLPVIMGEPPLQQSRAVVAFVGLEVTDIQTNKTQGGAAKKDNNRVVESISGVLVRPQLLGISGPVPTTGQHINDAAIDRLELGPIQLID